MKFFLRDRNLALVEAWRQFFGDNADFDIQQGDIFQGPPTHGLVSPANSFGFMDGGIDAYYIHRFGQQLEDNLRSHIHQCHYGEVPVGKAVIISTWDKDYPWLISAPTMRVPGSVKNTVNAYLAFRAVLIAVREFNQEQQRIDSITCPGLGTAIGQIVPFACAKQMYEAYKAVWLEKALVPNDCSDIWYNHQQLLGWPPYELKVNGKDVVKENTET